jgi:hypothetical protein
VAVEGCRDGRIGKHCDGSDKNFPEAFRDIALVCRIRPEIVLGNGGPLFFGRQINFHAGPEGIGNQIALMVGAGCGRGSRVSDRGLEVNFTTRTLDLNFIKSDNAAINTPSLLVIGVGFVAGVTGSPVVTSGMNPAGRAQKQKSQPDKRGHSLSI